MLSVINFEHGPEFPEISILNTIYTFYIIIKINDQEPEYDY